MDARIGVAMPVMRELCQPQVRGRIVAERAGGGTWHKIADELNRDQVATSQGGARWYPSSVRAAYLAADAVFWAAH